LLTGNERAEIECAAKQQAEAIALQASLAQQEAEAIALQASLAQQEAEAIALQASLAQQEAEAIALQEKQRADQERQQKEKLAAYLKKLGINPDEIS